jgi:hypothetical protein
MLPAAQGRQALSTEQVVEDRLDTNMTHCLFAASCMRMRGSIININLFVLSVSFVLQHYNIAWSMHVVFTYVILGACLIN